MLQIISYQQKIVKKNGVFGLESFFAVRGDAPAVENMGMRIDHCRSFFFFKNAHSEVLGYLIILLFLVLSCTAKALARQEQHFIVG